MKRIRKTVLNLPGPISYCTCDRACSQRTVDHVVPQSLIKKQMKGRSDLKKALNDYHNLYGCCRELNQKKSNKLLGKNYRKNGHESYLARSALYMNETYKLNVDRKIVRKWKTMSIMEEPHEFEKVRSLAIQIEQGNGNPYIDEYPGLISLV